MANRLASSTSPYLLQHADNPVDWWPWCEEAFAEAARRDVPVLLSVGYAACHWCHVMAHESFENERIAAVMNANFVSIKVDREERPDVDAIYMEATQAMTGHGGWPMTCFLTPTGEPFHCGTYFPPTPRHGLPGFPELLVAIGQAWSRRSGQVREAAKRIAEELAQRRAPLAESAVDDRVLAGAVEKLSGEFDQKRGGFGGAPKFPPSMLLEFLLRHHDRTGSQPALSMAERTCEAMARGGMYDQLAGGFARYSVDAAWVVPHFEKMLYDNALLLRVYTHLARLTGSATARRVAEHTAAFLIEGLGTPQGGFAASLDADTGGREGATYVWTPRQLAEVLGPEDGQWAARLLVVTEESGTFEHGTSVLQLPSDPGDPARWERVRAELLAARARRPQPGRDDKVVTEWNGMAITALAEAGGVLGHPGWIGAAITAAELILGTHLVDGRLRRSSRDGAVGAAAGVLADHAWLAEGLLALHQATGEDRWLRAAIPVLELAQEQFADPDHAGAWFDTAADAEVLFRRPTNPIDNATPAGASAMTGALVTASALTGSEAYRAAAEASVKRAGAVPAKAPQAAGHWLTVAEALAHGPIQVAVIGAEGDPARAALAAQARWSAPGGSVVLAGVPGAEHPMLAGRDLVDGVPAAYVCHGFVCDRPVTSPEALGAQLRSGASPGTSG
ncbi:MAG TPA: thioredoxin domain-containing protein [Pseudonocardiaceae bacterium]|nr:thioredoxin domain-containing protein [Pseudonocardiaceae bacterium]